MREGPFADVGFEHEEEGEESEDDEKEEEEEEEEEEENEIDVRNIDGEGRDANRVDKPNDKAVGVVRSKSGDCAGGTTTYSFASRPMQPMGFTVGEDRIGAKSLDRPMGATFLADANRSENRRSNDCGVRKKTRGKTNVASESR